jgi:hypothetical protein
VKGKPVHAGVEKRRQSSAGKDQPVEATAKHSIVEASDVQASPAVENKPALAVKSSKKNTVNAQVENKIGELKKSAQPGRAYKPITDKPNYKVHNRSAYRGYVFSYFTIASIGVAIGLFFSLAGVSVATFYMLASLMVVFVLIGVICGYFSFAFGIKGLQEIKQEDDIYDNKWQGIAATAVGSIIVAITLAVLVLLAMAQ